MCPYGSGGACGDRRGFSPCRWQNGRILQQNGRKVHKWHQRRDHLDKHKHGDRDSSSDSDRSLLHPEGKMHQATSVQRTIMTIQRGVCQTRARRLPFRPRVPLLHPLSAVFTRWQGILLQFSPILIH